MMLKRLVGLSILSATGLSWAADNAIAPRKPIPKTPTSNLTRPANASGRLIVKFADAVTARRQNDGSLKAMAPGRSIDAAWAIIERLGLQVSPTIRLPEDRIATLRTTAALRSGRGQPDIGGMFYLSGNAKALDRAAKVLNQLDDVEFVEYEPVYTPAGGGGCEDCGDAACGDCFTCHGEIFCNDPTCCAIVCEIDPYCCDMNAPALPGRDPMPQWDSLCVAMANTVCPGSSADTICGSPSNGPCFSVHNGTGCDNDPCCATVCGLDSFCCTVTWDIGCVETALENCLTGGTDDVTPSFTDAQGYLTELTYEQQWGAIPFNIGGSLIYDPCDPAPVLLLGYNGEGWDLDGLWNFGDLLISLGGGTQNLTRGESVRVGIIEHSAFADWQNDARTHEDLRGKVKPEKGQTIIINPSSPQDELLGFHGTACLGIVGAIDNGTPGHSLEALGASIPGGPAFVSDEVGIVGIAPAADLYFFPIVSIEEGGRLLNAMASAMNIFDPGDVLSFSIGPGGACGTLCSSQANWLMIRFGSDLGITSCIAAGNECCNLDGIAQAGGGGTDDCGVVIVGAGWPGDTHCRLGFSNHCRDCEDPDDVHVQAWGTAVTTLGYGNLFNGDDPENANGYMVRSYTNTFNGTSSACPQIAGLIADLQGLAKQFYGIPLMPEQIRSAVSAGHTQYSILGEDNLPGNVGSGYLGDFNFEEEPAKIGLYPNAVICAEGVVSSGFFDGNPLIDDIFVIRGDLVFGTTFSIRASDNNYLILQSEFTNRKFNPPFDGPAGQVTYLSTGQTTDLMVIAHSDQKAADLMSVTTEVQPPDVISIMMTEMYDWEQGEWAFVGVDVLVQGGDFLSNQIAFAAQRFINPDDKSVLIRSYVVGLGPQTDFNDGSTNSNWLIRYDLVDLAVANGFGLGFATPLF